MPYCQIAIANRAAMPIADSGMVRRDSMPAAMPSWIAATTLESVFNSGVSNDAAERPDRHEKEPTGGAKHQFGIVTHVARRPIHGAEHRRAKKGSLGETTAHEQQNREPGQELEVGAKHIFQADRLAGDVVGAEPFDVSARAAGEHGVNHEGEENRCRMREKAQQPRHYRPPKRHLRHQFRCSSQVAGIFNLLPQFLGLW